MVIDLHHKADTHTYWSVCVCVYMYVYMFVVNFDALAQASDFRMETSCFLCCM